LSLKLELFTRVIVDDFYVSAEQLFINGRCSLLQASFWAALQGAWQLQEELPISYVFFSFKDNNANFVMFFQSDVSLICNNFILNSCKVNWPGNSSAGKFFDFAFLLFFWNQVLGIWYYWITNYWYPLFIPDKDP
jgi:hypothetical protein